MDPGVIVGVLALIGVAVTAGFSYKATRVTASVSADEVESKGWSSLLDAHSKQLDRIHQDYQAEIKAIVSRHEAEIKSLVAGFHDEIRQFEERAREAESSNHRCAEENEAAKIAIHELEAKVKVLEESRSGP